MNENGRRGEEETFPNDDDDEETHLNNGEMDDDGEEIFYINNDNNKANNCSPLRDGDENSSNHLMFDDGFGYNLNNGHDGMRTTPDPYECNKCSQLFNTKAHLIKHFHTHHQTSASKTDASITATAMTASNTQAKSFECSQCFKCFTTRTTLIDHMRIHTGEKPFVCKLCNRCFNVKSNLVRHYKVHGEFDINKF